MILLYSLNTMKVFLKSVGYVSHLYTIFRMIFIIPEYLIT